jgi:hypothetical protein
MRLKGYLNEELLVIEELAAKLIKDCGPYLKLLSKHKFTRMLYRGSKNPFNGNITKVIPRKNREPKDMPQKLHQVLDAHFHKKFGWKARSEGVFVNPSQEMVKEYGASNLFFPIGKFKFVWSPKIGDLYSDFGMNDYKDLGVHDYYEYRNIWWHEKFQGAYVDDYHGFKKANTIEYFKELNKDLAKELISKQIKNTVNSYDSKNMSKLLASKNEASFKCDAYYMVWCDEWRLQQELAREFK